MNKVTVKNVPFKLIGESIKTNEVLDFWAKDQDNNDFVLADVEGMKVISVFPALNTRICDMQTLAIAKWAHTYKDIQFISVTNDPVEVIKEWCAAHGVENITIVSDRELEGFAKATNLKVKMWDKLARGFMILDENNKIIDQSFKEEEAADPDYALVEKYLK